MRRGATSPLNLTSLHYIMLTNAIAPTRSISFWFNVNIWRVQMHQGTALPFHPSKKTSGASTWVQDDPPNKPAMTNAMLFLISSSRAGGTNKLVKPLRNQTATQRGCRLLRLFSGFPGDAPKQRWSVPLHSRPSGIQLRSHFISRVTPASHESDDKQRGIECKHTMLKCRVAQWQQRRQNGCDNNIWCQQAPRSFHIVWRESNNEEQGTISYAGAWYDRWQPQSAVTTAYIVHEPFFRFTSASHDGDRGAATTLVFRKPLMHL